MSVESSKIWLSVPHMSGRELELVQETFASNWLSTVGPQIDAFELEVTARLGGTVHALAVGSGTAALHLVLRYIGVASGDRVAVASMTFAGSVYPIMYQGATPVFLDTDPDSYTLDPGVLEEYFASAAASNTLPKALITVHLYGQHSDLDPIAAACEKYGVVLIEDAAESLGSTYKGRQTGTVADYAILSFNGNKIITTTGGGMVLAKSASAIARMRKWANQSREPSIEYLHAEVGYNYRLSNVLAAVGRGQLLVLDDRVAARRAVAQRYGCMLEEVGGTWLSKEMPWGLHTRWLSVMRWDPRQLNLDAAEMCRFMTEHNIETRPVWRPMHTQPLFAGASYWGRGNDVESSRTSLCLPSSSSLSTLQQDRVLAVLRSMLAQTKR